MTGASFVDASWGTATLHLHGDADGIDVRWPATFVDFSTMTVAIDAAMIAEIGGDVDFHGTATVEVVATTDHETYTTASLPVDLAFRDTLAPAPAAIESGGVQFVNDADRGRRRRLLARRQEGMTLARVTGCFALDPSAGGDGTCVPVPAQDLPMTATAPLSRTAATFPFSPELAGIQPGTFQGQVVVVNQQAGEDEQAAAAMPIGYTLVTSQIFQVGPTAASLGQFVFVARRRLRRRRDGNGAVTELELVGTFTKTGGAPAQVDMTLIPEFVDGRLVRYVLNTDDALGQALDLTKDTGAFTGTVTPIVVVRRGHGARRRERRVVRDRAGQAGRVPRLPDLVRRGAARLRAARGRRRRSATQILATCQQAYRGVNIEFRTDPVTDFALFSNVELVGVDPNNMGLFGYDNSPGKDDGNAAALRRARRRQRGDPAGRLPGLRRRVRALVHGVLEPPGCSATAIRAPTRRSTRCSIRSARTRAGAPVTSEDLTGALPQVGASACPAADGDRATQIACAVYMMGNLIGGTLAHEIGHSLGLANPYGDGFHDAGDLPNRLMDAGGRAAVPRARRAGRAGAGRVLRRGVLVPAGDPAVAQSDGGVTRPSCGCRAVGVRWPAWAIRADGSTAASTWWSRSSYAIALVLGRSRTGTSARRSTCGPFPSHGRRGRGRRCSSARARGWWIALYAASAVARWRRSC